MNKEEQDFIVCRCEEVTLHDLMDTVEKYNCSSRELKMRTRASMGYCGGRTCRYLVDQITQSVPDEDTPNKIPLSYRPPVRPISFGNFGGEDNE